MSVAARPPVGPDASANGRAGEPAHEAPAEDTSSGELLTELLAEAIEATEGAAAAELTERALELAEAVHGGGDGEAMGELRGLVEGGSDRDLDLLARVFTRRFQLLNLADDAERARRVRAQEAAAAPGPRPGSLAEAVGALTGAADASADVAGLVDRCEARIVLTAHPTEARRRTTVDKLARIYGILGEATASDASPAPRADARRRLAECVEELWLSEDVRAASPSVRDEVETGLLYLASTVAEAIPRLVRELEDALRASSAEAPDRISPPLAFGAWMGGDRDGNPHVTSGVTVETLDLMRERCLAMLGDRLERLGSELSVSARLRGEPAELGPLLEAAGERFPSLAAALGERHPDEPYRRAARLLRERLRATGADEPEGYSEPAELIAELETLERALHSQGAAATAAGRLRDTIRLVEVFGFHFARLDIREHAKRHRGAVAELLRCACVEDSYESLDDERRAALLAREIANPRPLAGVEVPDLSEDARDLVETFRALRRLTESGHATALRSYVVSHASVPADLLEVLLLMKETGLAGVGGEGARLALVPLLETGDTLARAAETMEALLAEPVYRVALAAVGDEQEIMVGYSDSNKDVGFVASRWAVARAQARLAAVCREAGVGYLFFHGRGGSIGRGGGPSHLAVLGQPRGTVGGRLKVTEQGEVISAKYSLDAIAHRELELLASAALRSTVESASRPAPEREERYDAAMATLAEAAQQAYRDLVGDEAFLDFFAAATPIDQVSRARLGSRPAKRSASESIDDLRAIPWVFSWTQGRLVLPGWFGLGAALSAGRADAGLDTLRAMHREWPFFTILLDNAERALVQVDTVAARRYASLFDDGEARERILATIEHEAELAREGLIAVTEQSCLLERDPVLRESLARRAPALEALGLVQVELLRRLRALDEGVEDELLERAGLMAINGIAGGMRVTG